MYNDATEVTGISLEIGQYRVFLLRLARLQLNNSADAEDVVQETMMAAISGQAGFSGNSLRAWLTGILRHKIIDIIRYHQRFKQFEVTVGNENFEEFDPFFTVEQRWQEDTISTSLVPESAVAHQQLLEVIDFCLEKLPANTGKVFLLREFLGLEFSEIQQQLTLTETNLRALLYRARMRLRGCVSRGWSDC
ncbi:MAG: sigma-70 family RNA polymerase sigma factor [Methylotenera sp.]